MQCDSLLCICRFIVNYIGYGHDKPDSTDSEVTAKPTLSAYIVTENLECGTLRDRVLNQVTLVIAGDCCSIEGVYIQCCHTFCTAQFALTGIAEGICDDLT